MSNVLIPLGGSGGKNRGEGVQVDENYTYLKLGDSGVGMPLPAGNYKAMKAEHGEENPFASYGDGKNAIVFMTKDFLKKVTLDLFEIASITNFKLSMYGHKQVQLTWKNPSMGLRSGVRFVFKYDSLPINETDGFMVYDSADVHYETPLLEERELFVRAFNYVTVRDGRWYDEGKISNHIRVTGNSGAITLSAGAGVWTVPDGVRRIRYILVGHGGRGADIMSGGAGGGGGGGYFKQNYLDVYPGQQINWVIPSTIRDMDNEQANLPECDTVFGSDRVQSGRTARYLDYASNCSGGNGGSGGGGPHFGGGGNGMPGGANGSDGTQGIQRVYKYPASYAAGGIGQHTSTRGFNGVLYSGGGGAGAAAGGAGGGGNGGGPRWNSNGQNGTDGLGGGSGGTRHKEASCGVGGTGCIYIAWGSAMNDGS